MAKCSKCNRPRSWWAMKGDRCGGCLRAEERAAIAASNVEWFERTGHCGGCGQPGAYCLCTDARPCGCRDLHAMGSGIGVDPAALFADPVIDGQGELFA